MNILLVEDDQVTRKLLQKKIEQWGFNVQIAKDGQQAWDFVKHNPVDIVVSDWLMPVMNGLELCRKIRDMETHHYIYLIIISSQDTRQDIVLGLSGGLDDFIVKPFNMEELKLRIEIGARIVGLEKELNKKYDLIEKNYIQTIRMFIQLIESFDEQLGGHCRRVGALALKLARRHPLIQATDYSTVETAGLLHDIGMVGLSNDILSKRRNEMIGDQQQQYQSHSIRGEMILNEIEMLRPIAKLVRMHHEQFNGRGFPDGLDGSQIPLLAQIISAASIYDNFIFRGKIKLKDIPDNLQRIRGYQLDPELIELLLEYNLSVIQKEADKNYIKVESDDLKEGMILASDIRMKSGAMIMPAGTKLASHGISKLQMYVEMDNISKEIFILKTSM
jgi:putative two-component system response regulator